MILEYPSYDIIGVAGTALIESAGRLCYKSESKKEKGEIDTDFIKARIKSGHESILEHSMLSVKFVVNRGVTHELVLARHGTL